MSDLNHLKMNTEVSGVTLPPARKAPRSRFQAGAVAGMRIEPRDEELLCDLFLQRLMSRGQIEQLYFSSTVRCNARLRQLFDHKFVARYYPPIAPYGAQALYTVGTAALPLVARRLEMELPEVRLYHRRSKTPNFIEHTLAIVEVWLAFREVFGNHAEWEMERWLPELLCRHEYEIRAAGGHWRKEAFKPDAFVRLARRDADVFQSYFIEVDLGHTSSRQFLGKSLAHQRYLESGLFENHFDTDSFRTLVITTGERRLQNLLALVTDHNSDLFWFTTFDEVKQHTIIDPIWHTPSDTALCGLL
jgi:hypothetical protein